MGLSTRDWWHILKNSFKRFFSDNPFRQSAAIAYYTIFALPGIAIISVTVAGSFYEQETVKNQLLTQISLLMGDSSALEVESLMSKAAISGDSLMMKAAGVIILIISATTVFVSLQDTLNAIWKIKPKPDKEIVNFLLNRLLSLAMIVSIGFLVLVSLMADTLLAILQHTISRHLAGYSCYIMMGINIGISLGLVILIFASIYKFLPDAAIRWNDVWVGAIVTAMFFAAGKLLIGYYLSNSSLNDAYGAAGSLVAMLAWVYYSVIIFLFGAHFTFVYNKHKGRTIRPDKNAVAIKIQEIERGRESVTRI